MFNWRGKTIVILPLTTVFAYNTFTSLNLDGLSPCQLTFGRDPKEPLKIEFDPNISIPGSLINN